MLKYLLLTDFVCPGGPDSKHELFDTVEAAREKLTQYKRETARYGLMAGWMAPSLVQAFILEVKAVTET